MGEYDDIINFPHPVSKKHPQMSMLNRAAQFAPFAALTGHGAAIEETARLTDSQIELDENGRAELDRKMEQLLSQVFRHPTVTITYFQPDARKAGGAYFSITATVKKWDEYEQTLIMTDGTELPVQMILDIRGEFFDELSSD